MKGGTSYGRCTVRRSAVPPHGVPGCHRCDPRGVSDPGPPFETAFHAHLAAWRLDGQPRTARQCSVDKNSPLPAIPGGRLNPVTTPISQLAFRKHPCDNTPLTGTFCWSHDEVGHVDGCSQRTQISLRRCALSLGSQWVRQHRG